MTIIQGLAAAAVERLTTTQGSKPIRGTSKLPRKNPAPYVNPTCDSEAKGWELRF